MGGLSNQEEVKILIDRRRLLVATALSFAFGTGGMAQAKTPPVPKWRPAFHPPLSEVIGRFQYYRNNAQDFIVFKNGTCVHTENGLTEYRAFKAAKLVLKKIVNFHPDFRTFAMDDGNYLVTYNHPAFNVILEQQARANWSKIDRRHLDGLSKDEVVVGPKGLNVFDRIGKIGLLGRCYMFMDAQNPKAVQLVRAS